jgi:hypothetical protein
MIDEARCVERDNLMIFGPAWSRPKPPCPRCGGAIDKEAFIAVHCRRCHAEDMKRFDAALLEARNSQLQMLPGGRQCEEEA